jgi:hypothetical protein
MGDEIAAGILRYLASKPSAQDTLEGIIEWSQSGRNASRLEGQVRVAILELQAKGLVMKIAGRTSIHYRLTRRMGD